jgi:enamine deaminase RidA (YjgF/YER057c/UK114 family)
MSTSPHGHNREINPGWRHFDKYTFAPAILRDGFLFVSGMTAGAIDGGILHPGDIAAQTDVILQRLGDILSAARCGYGDVVATREFITTIDGYRKTADVRRKYFKPPFPAATGVIVSGLLRPGALIEIEAIAAVPEDMG